MPCSAAKARILLKEKKAEVARRTPFTIRLKIATGEAKQPVSLGVDAGYKHVGLSASTEKTELYASEIELRQDITDLLSARLALRRGRRNRKTRYRAARFNNRMRSKRKGWLAPSVENRINAHLSRIEAVLQILPVTKITVETAAFDTQLLKKPDIAGEQYQQGEQLGFWNVLNRLKAAHPELEVRNTYGYLTKHARIKHGIPKSHCADAFCIAGNFHVERLGCYFFQKQTRHHNRQIHKLTIQKGGERKLNQAPYVVKNFRLFDKVACKGEEAFIFGRRSSGYFDVRKLDGTRISAGISCKKLRLIERRRTYLTEIRKEAALPPLPERRGLRAVV